VCVGCYDVILNMLHKEAGMHRMKRYVLSGIMAFLVLFTAVYTHKNNVWADEEKITLSVWSFTDELKSFIDRFQERNPDIRIEMTKVPANEYLEKITPVLKHGGIAPDVYAIEYGIAREVGKSFYEDLSAPPYNADTSAMIPFVVEVGKDAQGRLRAVSWQACVGGFFYRRSTAKEYLGTDNPEQIGDMLSTPQKFLDTARLLKQKSGGTVKLLAGFGDYQHYPYALRAKSFVTNGRLNIEQCILDYFNLARIMVDEELTMDVGTWSPWWFENMNKQEPDFLGYVMATWGNHYVLKPNTHDTKGDWALCRGPASYFWGGTWLGIYKNSKHKDAAWRFVKFVCMDHETLTWWAREKRDFVNNLTVINDIKGEFGDEFLGGQNYYEFFAEEALKIDGSLLREHDLDIRGFLMGAVSAYVEGTLTKQQAIEQFKSDVKKAFPEVSVE
jgi:multiple sugar transport system substrate-binding protein